MRQDFQLRTETAIHIPQRVVRDRTGGIAEERLGLGHQVAHALALRRAHTAAAELGSLIRRPYSARPGNQSLGQQRPVSAMRFEHPVQSLPQVADRQLAEPRAPTRL